MPTDSDTIIPIEAAATAAAPVASAPAELSLRDSVAALIELTKPGITKLVLVTTAVGFALGALGRTWDPIRLVIAGVVCLAGTALCSSSANALNQLWERRRDALMPRTCARPLPTHRVSALTAGFFGVTCGLAGVWTLAIFINPAAALVALTTIITYVLIYTPMKTLSTAATIVGAVPGALPPVIGFAAASPGAGFDSLAHPAPWSLFAVMFIWQIPHFLAIAWMHRDGYARGGFRVLPLFDPDGGRTARASLAWLGALIPVSLWPILAMPGRIGWGYAAIAIGSGVFFLIPAIRFHNERTIPNARRLFFASIIYLPVLLLAMVADAMVTSFVLR